MASVNVTIRMDKALKKQADELFTDLGLSMSAAFTMFTKQAIREQRIPFEITRNNLSIADDTEIAALSQNLIQTNKQAYMELAK